MDSMYCLGDELKDVDTPDVTVSGVLLASLEKAARIPDFYGVDLNEVFNIKAWDTYQNVYGGDKDPFTETVEGHVIDPIWARRLQKSTIEINKTVRVLESLLDHASQVRERFRLSRERIAAAKRSNGIKSLPDEIVERIFQFSVSDMEHKGDIQATWISQVSRRFRRIALGMHSLWTTLFSLSSQSHVEMYIRRAGPNAKFQAFIHLDFLSNMRTFISICRPIISRWKTLTLFHEYEFPDQSMRAMNGDSPNHTLRELFVLLGDGLSTPIFNVLDELVVRADESGNMNTLTEGRLPIDTQAWAPSLHKLRCSYFLPSPSVPLSSISTLVVTQNFPRPPSIFDSPQKKLLELLLKLPNLSDFILEAHEVHESSDEVLPITECTSITSFRLQLPHFRLLEFSTKGSRIAGLMDALRMPSLEESSISIGLSLYGKADTESEWSRLLGHLSSALLPAHFSISISMKSLVYELYQTYETPSNFKKRLNIPLDAIVRIPSVTISSPVRVLFSWKVDDGAHHTINDGYQQLRELRFTGCENMTPLDLRCTVENLESHGVWNDIERIVVQDCAHLMREDASNAIGEKRLQYLDGYFDSLISRAMRKYDRWT